MIEIEEMNAHDHAARLAFYANNLPRLDAIAADLGESDAINLITEWLVQKAGKGTDAGDLIGAAIQAALMDDASPSACANVDELHEYVNAYYRVCEEHAVEQASADPYDRRCDERKETE